MINLSCAYFSFMLPVPGLGKNCYELSGIAGKDARKNWNSLIF
jgi:hypothetical protein